MYNQINKFTDYDIYKNVNKKEFNNDDDNNYFEHFNNKLIDKIIKYY